MTIQETEELVAKIAPDEATAFEIFNAMMHRFGWAGTVFSRSDAETVLGDQDGRRMTEDEWATVRNSYEWRKMSDRLTEIGWEHVNEAVRNIDAKAVNP